MDNRISELVKNIDNANVLYRTGQEIVTDSVYDSWLDELKKLDPNNKIFDNIGYVSETDVRRTKLPIKMASMEKLKTVDDIHKWMKSKNIPNDTEFILTPKLDGCSGCSNENTKNSYTRGDGEYGQNIDEHMSIIDGCKFNDNVYTYGEIIIKQKTFIDKYSDDYANGRNMVAGALNRKNISVMLEDFDYIRYGLVSYTKSIFFNYKSELLDYLNNKQKVKIGYKKVVISDLTEEYLKDLYLKWSSDYAIDGIIIEVNDLKFADELGRERNSNPAFARAFKGNFEEVKETIVENIEWNISKKGYLIPRIRVKTINLDGADVTYVTGNNASYIKDMGIGVGSKVMMKRSGLVIPLIVEVLNKVDFKIPTIDYDLKWDDNNVHLITIDETDEQRLQQLISFFKILEVDNVSEGIIKQLFDSGYNTVKKILLLKESDLLKLDRFGERKAEIVYNEIKNKMMNVTLSKVQHASGFFNNLGSKKLLLLENLENQTRNSICEIEGFSDLSAISYFNGIDKFNEFIDDLGDLITIKKTEVKKALSDDLKDMVVVFSGVRRKDLNEIIESRGGRVASGVSAKITHLVMKETGTGSSKEVKASKLGKKIITVEELEKLL